MRTDGSLVGTRWGPISAIGPQPRRRHENEVWAHTPTAPWGSRRLPRTVLVGDPRRTLFRELLRRSEGVPVAFADGGSGRVAEVIFPALGFDFWPEALVVATLDGKWRVPTSTVARIDTRAPRIEIGERSEPWSRSRAKKSGPRFGRRGATTAPVGTQAEACTGRSSTPTTGSSSTSPRTTLATPPTGSPAVPFNWPAPYAGDAAAVAGRDRFQPEAARKEMHPSGRRATCASCAAVTSGSTVST